jgi:hypothetical protein
LDISKVDLGEAHAVAASAPPQVTMRAGGATVATCMPVCETKRTRGGPVHAWARAASVVGWVRARGSSVCQARVREHRPTLASRIKRPDASKSEKEN